MSALGGIVWHLFLVGCSLVVRYPSERAGSNQMSLAMRDFSDFIFSLGLLDIPMEGGNMTWSNSISHSKLDRFLFSLSLEDHFTKIV